MITKLIFLSILAFSILSTWCSKKSTDSQEGILQGVITLEGQADHGGIRVQLRELGLQATTTTDGSYSFSSIPAGTYSLLATDSDTSQYLFDFAIVEGISVTKGRTTVAPSMQLSLFKRIESDLSGQVRWTAEDGPYLITRSVTVQSGAHLNIEPGTIIKFADYYRLTVLGRIVAKGTTSDSILFTSVKVEGTPGDWDRIILQWSGEETSDTLSHCRIQFANIGLDCSQTSPVISGNTICQCFGYGIVSTTSAAKIIGNVIRHNYGGISSENGCIATIKANLIEENTYAGIACSRSQPNISDNIISKNQHGLLAQSAASPFVWHNQFFSNEDAIYLHHYCNPHIEANDIYCNDHVSFYITGWNQPSIHYNNITESGAFAIYIASQYEDIPAQNNWWGKSNLSEIGTLIWDMHDNANLGEILLDPILEAPVDSAGPRYFP